MADKNDAPSKAPGQVASSPAELEKRIADLQRRVDQLDNRVRGAADKPEGHDPASVGYQLDRLTAIAIKYHHGDLLDYDRNAHFYAGNVTSGQPENIGPTPPRREPGDGPFPVDPRVTVRGDQVTEQGEAAGALDASKQPAV